MIHIGETGDGKRPDVTQYFLQTERIGFRCWSEGDLGLAMDLWGDGEVTRLIGGPFSPDQVRERLSREIASREAYGVQYWPIFLLSDNEYLGCCGLRSYALDRKIYEIGVHIRSAHWGHGYALEATRGVITYAFGTVGAAGLFAGHNPANETSRHLLEKLGFRYTHDEFYPPTGLDHPSYLLTPDEWGRGQKESPLQ